MTDEGLREIRLDGKQLVFLFMAATVVAVVIFLSGVLVGRGVPAGTGLSPDENGESLLDPTDVPPRPSNSGMATGATAPVASGEELSYTELLGGADTSGDTLKPASEGTAPPIVADREVRPVGRAAAPSVPKPAPTSVANAVSAPARLTPRTAAQAPATSVTFAEPNGNGYVVQVAAVQKRDEANRIARRLTDKGYPAFVTTFGSNFRVRVGKYRSEREAETVANRLEREERMEPWVTR